MSSAPEAMRQANLKYLTDNGFQAATWLPLPPAPDESGSPSTLSGALRPTEEIAHRYLALFGVYAWAAAPPQVEDAVANFIQSNHLRDAMASKEIAIVDLPKAAAMEQYQGTIGWRLENMWSMAWVLGMAPEPSAISGQLPAEVTGQLIDAFVPDLAPTVESILAKAAVQANAEVVRLWDLFYCAHNAVRSAQLGHPTVPEGFDPIASGGAVHERRHSLEWCLTPGATWDSIELHT